MFQLVNQTTNEKETGVYGALAKVALVFSQGNRISEMDFVSSQRIIQGSMQQFPDLYFVFVSNDINSFVQMVSDERQGRNAKLVSINYTIFSQFFEEYPCMHIIFRPLRCRNVITTSTQIQ